MHYNHVQRQKIGVVEIECLATESISGQDISVIGVNELYALIVPKEFLGKPGSQVAITLWDPEAGIPVLAATASGSLGAVASLVSPVIAAEPAPVSALPAPFPVAPVIPALSTKPVPSLPGSSSGLVLWPPPRNYEVDRALGEKRQRRFFLILLLPLILLLLLTGLGIVWPRPATAIAPPSTSYVDTGELRVRPHHFIPKLSVWSCQSSEDVKNGRDAGGKVPVDLGTKHAQNDQVEDCELFFGSEMHSFIAMQGWLIEEQRVDGSVYIWAGDGQKVVRPSQNQITFVEFYETPEKAREAVSAAKNDWIVELGIDPLNIHV